MKPFVAIIVVLGLTACGGERLTPANVATEPGGGLAVAFTRTFPAGFWDIGDHAYRLVLVCPNRNVGPPVIRFEVSEDAPRFGTVYLRLDGPGRHLLAPADLASVHPEDVTVAVITLAGMTETAAEEVGTRCQGTVVYDGLDPEELKPGPPFSP